MRSKQIFGALAIVPLSLVRSLGLLALVPVKAQRVGGPAAALGRRHWVAGRSSIFSVRPRDRRRGSERRAAGRGRSSVAVPERR